MPEDGGNQELRGDGALPLVTELQRAVHVIGVRLDSSLGDLNLSQGEMHVLSLLGHQGVLSVAHLQRGVRHRPSTLTGILDRLTAKGLARRRMNEDDHRSYLIELTPAGRVAAERVLGAMREIEERLADGRTAADMAGLSSMLREISTQL